MQVISSKCRLWCELALDAGREGGGDEYMSTTSAIGLTALYGYQTQCFKTIFRMNILKQTDSYFATVCECGELVGERDCTQCLRYDSEGRHGFACEQAERNGENVTEIVACNLVYTTLVIRIRCCDVSLFRSVVISFFPSFFLCVSSAMQFGDAEALAPTCRKPQLPFSALSP